MTPPPKTWRFLPYPFLIAMYPVLSLAAKNGSSLLSWLDLAVPLAIVLGVALVVWAVASRLTPDAHRRAALTALAMALFGMHGPIAREFHFLAAPRGAVLVNIPFVPVLILLAVGGLGLWIVRSRADLAATSRYLNVTAMILVVWSLLTVTISLGYKQTPPLAAGDVPEAVAPSRSPDIFIIVLDKYTGTRALASHYGFDNTDFEDRLRGRGFVVPRAARTNYIHTFLVLPALLNFRYLEDVPRVVGNDEWDHNLTKTLVDDSRTHRLLRGLGYRIVHFNTTYPVTTSNPHADRQLPGRRLVGQFAYHWLNETPLIWGPIAMCRLRPCQTFPYAAESATQIEWKFDQLAQLSNRDGPMLVFAHLLVPHEPYLFKADCSHREPWWPLHDADQAGGEAAVKTAYIEQVTCVNRYVERLVDRLITRPNAPIIILQSDHGHGRFGRTLPELSVAAPDNVRERLEIFAAYYLPDGGAAHIYDTISPVNVMRVVLNHYFRTNLPMLQDRSYWSPSARPYALTPIE